MLGIVVELIFSTTLHDSRLTRTVENWIFDSTTTLAERTQGVLDSAVPFVLVDIDRSTSGAWGFPLITPRDYLAEIVQRVATARPAVIILDIDLAWPDLDGNNERFARFLQFYPSDAPRLVIATSLKPSVIGIYPTVRDTPFDAMIAGRPNIHKGTAQFAGDGDRVTRRWRLYEPVCADGVPTVLPSIVLAGAAAVDTASQQSLSAALKSLVPNHCEAPASAGHAVAQIGKDVTLTESRDERRMIYSVRWQPRELFLGPWTTFHGKQVRLVTVRPANTMLATDTAPESPAILADRIVVIASSFGQIEDYHLTPLGMMPGGLVVINAIHTLLQRGSPVEPHLAIQLLIAGALIIANALAFCFLRLFVAVLVALLLVVGLMIMTIGWFQAGTVLDLAAPSIGVLIHRAFVLLESGYEAAKRQGLRVMLRQPRGAGRKRRKPRSPPAGSLLIVLAILLAPLAARAAGEGTLEEVGLVETYLPPKDQYVLRRGGDDIPLTIAGPIMNGDIMMVRTPKGRVELRLSGEKRNVIVSQNNSPYRVKVAVLTPGFASGLYTWFAGAIDAAFARQHEEDRYPAVGRGEDRLEMPLLTSPQKIVGGKRALIFGWTGGKGQVRIKLSRVDSQASLIDATSRQRSWTSPAINFSAGRYRVEITDAASRQATGIIEVVDEAALPKHSALPVTDRGPLRVTVAAAWLSSQAKGEYALESLQRVAPLSRHFYPAKILERALIEGQRVGE